MPYRINNNMRLDLKTTKLNNQRNQLNMESKTLRSSAADAYYGRSPDRQAWDSAFTYTGPTSIVEDNDSGNTFGGGG